MTNNGVPAWAKEFIKLRGENAVGLVRTLAGDASVPGDSRTYVSFADTSGLGMSYDLVQWQLWAHLRHAGQPIMTLGD
jgi:hypothetical protein